LEVGGLHRAMRMLKVGKSTVDTYWGIMEHTMPPDATQFTHLQANGVHTSGPGPRPWGGARLT